MSANNIVSLKRKLQTTTLSSYKQIKSRRHSETSEDDIIRSRLFYEGDQGSDDRRISLLLKTFYKSLMDVSIIDIEKLFSLLYSIEHSYRLLKLTIQMDEYEQINYRKKSQYLHEQIQQLRIQLNFNEKRLMEAKQKCLNILEYDKCTDQINKLGTRKELRTQQILTLERKRYFEHLQQTFEANYQQRLKQIAIYMRPIFELDEILQQDSHEDTTLNESSSEQQTTPTTPVLSSGKTERSRTYSDSSITSMGGDENIRLKKLFNQSQTISSDNNEPQPLFLNDVDLFGTQLVNPLLVMSG